MRVMHLDVWLTDDESGQQLKFLTKRIQCPEDDILVAGTLVATEVTLALADIGVEEKE